MTKTTIQLTRASIEAYVPSDRCAVSTAVFNSMLAQHLGSEWAGIEEIAIDRCDDDFDALDALDDDLRDRSGPVSDFAGDDAWVLLTGEGEGGCDVWALATIAD